MLEKTQFPASLRVDLDVAYGEVMTPTVNADYRRLIEIVPTTSNAKEEVFYGDKGRLRIFSGERQPQSFNEYRQNLTLKEWEMTINPKRDVLTDDQSGGKLRQIVTDFSTEVASSKEAGTWEFAHTLMATPCFDGANFFSQSHVFKTSAGVTLGPVQSNLELGNSQLDATTLQADMQKMASWLTDAGKPMGARVTDIVVRRGSANSKMAYELANSSFTVEVPTAKGANTINVFKGKFNVIETDYGLTYNEWMLLDLSTPSRKPIKVLSSSVDAGFDNLAFEQLVDGSENAFWRNEFAFGVRGKFGWNPGYWYTALMHGISTSTTATAFVTDYERQ